MDKTWALVAYTLLTQMSVGTFLVYWIYFLSVRRGSGAEIQGQVHRPLLTVAVLLLLGMIVSLFHLERPLMAYRSVVNVGSSWLSREILFTVLYGLFGLLYIGAVRARAGLPGWRSALGWLVALSGIGLVHSMARIYMIQAVPSWNTVATPLTFFTAALLLGGLITGTLYQTGGRSGSQPVESTLFRWIGLGSIVLLGIQVVALVLGAADIQAQLGMATVALGGGLKTWLVVYLALAFVGAGCCGALLYGEAVRSPRNLNVTSLASVALALVLASQLVHRYLFYTHQIRIGL